jgi:predicted ester cyclase
MEVVMNDAAGNKEFVTEYLRSLSGQTKTPELVARFVSDRALAEHIHQAEAAFPSYEIEVDEMIAERDLVALRGTFRGVHQGTFAGVPATGRRVSAGLMIFYRINDRRIVEHWMQFDTAALIAQLSEAPAVRA